MSRSIAGLREIVAEADGVLIDQYGVLHDGRAAFPGAQDAVRELHARKIPMVALTNSGKRADPNLERLARLGFPRDWFCGLVSSGELAREELILRLRDGRLSAGAQIGVISRDDDTGAVDGLALAAAEPNPECALLLIAGARPESVELSSYESMLAPLADRGVPALCANPDVVIYSDGASDYGPGRIAELYRALGGRCEMLGKPGARMFAAGLAMLGSPSPARVLMIGDSLMHDITGANAAGCLSLMVRGGVQAGLESSAVEPDFVVDRLVW